jgi:hypothetical protein
MSNTTSFVEKQRRRAEAERLRDEAAEFRAAAEKDLADARYLIGQAEVRAPFESSEAAYRRAYPQFYRTPTRRQMRRLARRGG